MNSEVGETLLLGAVSLFVLILAKRRGFFALAVPSWEVPLRWIHVVAAFAIYFGIVVLLSPLLATLLRHWVFPGPGEFLSYVSWMNFLNSAAILSSLALFIFRLPATIYSRIWHREEKKSVRDDLLMAAFCWLLSFPLVLFLSQFFDLIVTQLFHVKELPEQLAVHFLKMTFGHPLYFTLAIMTITLFAPIIEETLFRGFLQSFIRQHLGSKQAIFITSLCFSFFHYSPEQGLGNIPIIASLFALALFLGFAYERRGSLLSPIALHASFNVISVINLYFLGGFPKGQGPI